MYIAGHKSHTFPQNKKLKYLKNVFQFKDNKTKFLFALH